MKTLSHSSSFLFRSANENGDRDRESVGDGECRAAGRDSAPSQPERPGKGQNGWPEVGGRGKMEGGGGEEVRREKKKKKSDVECHIRCKV
jgi:hypothetical protein